jgi:hypothetical protein
MINWVAWRYQPSRGPQMDEVAATLAEMALASVPCAAFRAQRHQRVGGAVLDPP